MERHDNHRSDDRLHALELTVFGKPGERGLAHIVRDNTVLMESHIQECKEAREEQRQQAESARAEAKRQFWGIIGAIIAALATAFITKLIS